jgi:Flp pilus assembly protein TadD
VDEAIAQCQKALAIQPDYAAARINLGAALMQAGRMAEALGEYWKVLETQPENMDALNNLAWALATGPQATLRDGVSAVALAQKAVRLSGGENPRMLRTLAAADAEAGRFAEAAETARQALQLASGQKNDALAATLQKELELYQMNTPMREVKP